jgi:benzil reductase ((S)-benzoin forming)
MKILVTGTSSGFGHGIATHYLEKGHTVYGISRKQNDELAARQNFRFLSQDLSRFDEMEKNIPPFLKQAGELDLAILNAGVLPEIKDMKDCSIDEIRKVMDINVWSNKILIDLMISNLAGIRQIVAISSGAAVYGNRGWNSYSLSKAALNMLIMLYSREQPSTHFSSIAPGLVDTGMQEYISSLPDDERFPTIDNLKKARGTSQMPAPAEAAKILSQVIEKIRKEESGSFKDVRTINTG